MSLDAVVTLLICSEFRLFVSKRDVFLCTLGRIKLRESLYLKHRKKKGNNTQVSEILATFLVLENTFMRKVHSALFCVMNVAYMLLQITCLESSHL